MPIEITVPRLGWSMEEGIFAGWLKADGDTVTAGEPLFALESEKVTMEVESLDNGTLRIAPDAPAAGGTVTVGQRLGHLLQPGDADDTIIAMGQKLGSPASPRARAAAERLGVDIANVTPREPGKRIIEADVLQSANKRPSTTATRMEDSFRAPHFYLHADALAGKLAALRADMPGKPSFNSFLIKAAALALREHPGLNAHWENGAALANSSIDIGLAVDADDRLLVPVVRNAAQLTVTEIAKLTTTLADRCRTRQIQKAELDGGSLTITNLGPFGVDRFQAILNPPQSVIIAIGRISNRPIADAAGNITAALTVPISLSVDHRVVNGVAAAKFLHTFTSLIESPLRLVLIQ